MWKWEKGKWVGDNPSWQAIEEFIHEGATRRLRVRDDGGTIRRATSTEILFEKMFRQGIEGSVKMQKLVLRYAKKYVHSSEKPKEQKKTKTDRRTIEITQQDVDYWKATGSLPVGCSDVLKEISLQNLNKALKTHLKKQRAKLREATEILEKDVTE